MKNEPNRAARLVALVAVLLAPLAACQGPDAVTPSSPDSSAKVALTASQAQALSDLGKMLRRPTEGLPTTRAYGGVRVDLQGGYHHAVMVQVNPDGSHTFVCTDSIDTATEFLTRGASVTGNEE